MSIKRVLSIRPWFLRTKSKALSPCNKAKASWAKFSQAMPWDGLAVQNCIATPFIQFMSILSLALVMQAVQILCRTYWEGWGFGPLLVEVIVRIPQLHGNDESSNTSGLHRGYSLFNSWDSCVCTQFEVEKLPISSKTKWASLCLHCIGLSCLPIACSAVMKAAVWMNVLTLFRAWNGRPCRWQRVTVWQEDPLLTYQKH